MHFIYINHFDLVSLPIIVAAVFESTHLYSCMQFLWLKPFSCTYRRIYFSSWLLWAVSIIWKNQPGNKLGRRNLYNYSRECVNSHASFSNMLIPMLVYMHAYRQLFKATIILLPLLGLTWVFGLLSVNSSTIVFAWLFSIFNSLQGLFVFIFHVLRSEKVRVSFWFEHFMSLLIVRSQTS